MVRTRPLRFTALSALAACVLLAGCAHHREKLRNVTELGQPEIGKIKPKKEKKNRAGQTPDQAAARLTQIGVNAYLWRAALDTLSFMPLLQTDSDGGVILTDWFINPKAPGERMKLTVTILDRDLRADALRVAASRQVQQNGQWVDAPVEAVTTQKLEDIILTHARDLRRREVNGIG